MPSDTPCPLVIWRLSDGKPGHEKQTLGLARALLKNRDGVCHTLPAPASFTSLAHWLTGRFPPGRSLPSPDVILAAGHATHLALLAARRARGGEAVLLMRPSLPLFLFDLCLIPEHDSPPRRDNVIPLRGVLNDVATSTDKDPGLGLMLIGGVSTHYRWDETTVWRAVETIARTQPGVAWRLTTSRRTPESFLKSAPGDLPANLSLIPHTQTGPGWLESALADCAQVWVTEDSVSMLYEALTAGAAVGLLRLPALRSSRVRQGVERLLAEGWITAYDDRRAGVALATAGLRFNEAERVAPLILERLSAAGRDCPKR